MTDSRKNLGIYLNDHLAGATAGLDLARRAARNNRGTSYGKVLQTVAEEIEVDRQTLVEIVHQLRVREDLLKEAVGWVLEKAARLKLNGRLFGYSPVSRLLELESLVVGVTGKQALWRSLQLVENEVALEGFDFAALEKRAGQQIRKLERCRQQAVEELMLIRT